MDIVFYLVIIAFYQVIFLHTDALGGWNQAQIQVFVASVMVVDAIYMTVFANNCWWFPILVNRGDLDFLLTRPVSPFFIIGFKDFSWNSMINLIIAIGYLVWSISEYPAEFGFIQCSIYALLILNGSFVFFLTTMAFMMPVFWTHSDRGLWPLYLAICKAMEKPEAIFPSFFRHVFTFIFPFFIMTSYPLEFLFGTEPAKIAFTVLIFTLFFTWIFSLLWKRALQSYGSASS
jgi:ABC-2 type transport system permease protein